MSARGKCRRGPRFTSLLVVLVRDLFGLLELMRYEGCFPTTQEEAFKVLDLANGRIEEAVIHLWMVAASEREPDRARARTFGVHVLGQWHPDESPPTGERLADLARLAKDGASS